LSPVISIDDLRALAGDGLVAFDSRGGLVDVGPLDPVGPATLIVSEVTDALKRVDDRGTVVESLDRSQSWMVEAIVLSSSALAALSGDMEVEDLLLAVPAAGFEWVVSPTSAP